MKNIGYIIILSFIYNVGTAQLDSIYLEFRDPVKKDFYRSIIYRDSLLCIKSNADVHCHTHMLVTSRDEKICTSIFSCPSTLR